MAKAEYQHIKTNVLGREYTVGYCSNCGGIVMRSQYGIDEECPNCDADIDWQEGSEEEE